jgi:hypothetical protein
MSPSFLTRAASLPALLLCLSYGAHAAQPDFKPGLWEVKNKAAGMGDGQMQAMLAAAQEQLAARDPALRAKMDAAMAQNGVTVDRSGTVSAKLCITPEMVARQQLPIQQKGACKMRFDPSVGNSTHYSYACTAPVAATGDGTITFSSPTSYTAVSRTTAGQGMPPLTVQSEGRWLASDCGTIAPLSSPAE